jgi:tRNA(Ile)-lysidine synthase
MRIAMSDLLLSSHLVVPEEARQRSVLVAVSGGADSTALALLLAGAKTGPLELAHVSHGLRSRAAEEELAVVDELSRGLAAELHVERLEPPSGFVRGGKVPEAWAREQRYRALAAIARRRGIEVLATGHHARDRRETQLLQLLRGAGLRGLAGMRPLRRLGGVWLWRPLLGLEPERMREWLRQRGIRWIEDPSNDDLRVRRNLVRHALVPELARRRDPLLERLDRLAELALRVQARVERECDRLLDGQAVGANGSDEIRVAMDVIGRLSPLLLRELLDRASARLRGAPPLRTRRRELAGALGWTLDPRSRGTRRIGSLTMEKSRGALVVRGEA